MSAAVVVMAFLCLPILVVIPLSFNDEPYFTFPIHRFSWRWYEAFFGSDNWRRSLWNSMAIAMVASALATALGAAAAFGLARSEFRGRSLVLAILGLPMLLPSIVFAIGTYFFFSRLGMVNSFLGMVIAHTVLAIPFVVITVLATLSRFDFGLMRAAASLGAPPLVAARRILLPLIFPGVASGALLAFATSFDEVVVALFISGPDWRTLPRQMFSGMREELSPTITAAATLLFVLSLAVILAANLLRGRAARLTRQARPNSAP